MITISKLPELRLFRSRRIKFETENRLMGTVIFNLSNDSEDIHKWMATRLFFTHFIRGIYAPRFLDSPYVRRVRQRFPQKEYYEEMILKTPQFKIARRDLSQYMRRNVVYDLAPESRFFFAGTKVSERRRISLYRDFLKAIFEREIFNQLYEQKVVVVPINQPVELNSSTIRSPIDAVLGMMRYKELKPDDFGDIPFIFHNAESGFYFKVYLNGDRSKYQRLIRLTGMLSKLATGENLEPEEMAEVEAAEREVPEEAEPDSEEAKAEKAAKIANKIMKAFQADPQVHALSGKEQEVADKIEQKAMEVIEKTGEDVDEREVIEELDKDEEIARDIAEMQEKREQGRRAELRKKRIENLRQAQDKVDVGGGMTLSELLKDFEADSIDLEEMNVDTLHDEVKVSKLKDFDRSYNEKQLDQDIFMILSAFNDDEDLPLFIEKIERKDTSDDFNKKETITVIFRDSDGVRHTFKVDFPKFIDQRFMYIKGGKKSLAKQITLLPVVKMDPDTVQLTSNYSKMMMKRFGSKLDPKIELFKKFIGSELKVKNRSKLKITHGDNRSINANYESTLEYDDLSGSFIEIEVGDFVFLFDRKQIEEILEERDISSSDKNLIPEGEYPVGYSKSTKTVITEDLNTGEVRIRGRKQGKGEWEEYIDNSLVDAIIAIMSRELEDDSIQEQIYSAQRGRKFTYSRVRIMGRYVPTIAILGFKDGLEEVMTRYGIDYEFSPVRKRLTPEERSNLNWINFKNGVLYYPSRPLRNSLLLNGLLEFPTREYDFHDFNEQDVYVEIFEQMYGTRNIAKGLRNFYAIFLDPITKEILRDMGIDDDFTGLLLHANTLLESSTYRKPNDLANYRIRGNEQVVALYYKILAEAYRNYREARAAGNKVVRVTVKQDALLKELLENNNVEEYSVLNPILEIENSGKVTYKGHGGINLDEAFGLGVRAYDETMLGVLGINTPDSQKVGVVRQLTYNPHIINTRGMIMLDKDKKNLNPTDMMTPAELLSPFTGRHADPPRISMQVQQSKHVMPTKEQSKPLFGSGVEKTLPHMLGTDFVFRAKQDGVVEKIDEETELMIIRYKDGTKDAVDLSSHPAHNSNGGFWISNKKETNLKEGQTFKAGDIIAMNPHYFTGDKNNVTLTVGKLAKVAIHSGDYTYEDSSIITQYLSDAMASEVTIMKAVNLGPNTNIQKIVKKGDLIKAGDPLIVFESSFDEGAANVLLDRIGQEFEEVIEELGRNVIRSKYTGEIVDIKIYYNRELDEMSPSVQKLIKSYEQAINKKKKVLKDGGVQDATGIILPPTGKIDEEKIQGQIVDGLLIEFYIKYYDYLKTGDKITFNTALKSIIADVIEEGQEPFSEYREDEPIHAIISPLSIVSRMTTDVYSMLWLNKVLIELKNKVREIYEK